MNITTDFKFMLMSIDYAIQGVQNNPTDYGGQVGSILVNSKAEVIAKSYNRIIDGQRKHAEEIIINSIRTAELENATLYVTVEPCNGNPYHSRKHCCEQIADSGIQRVVIGVRKEKFEGGMEYMMKHGVSVDILENKRIKYLCNLLKSSGKNQSFSKKVLNNISSTRSAVRYTL